MSRSKGLENNATNARKLERIFENEASDSAPEQEDERNESKRKTERDEEPDEQDDRTTKKRMTMNLISSRILGYPHR